MKVRNFLFAFGLGVLCMFIFGLIVATLDDSRSYSVMDTDDHMVILRSPEGGEVRVFLENVPESASCFERGAIWLIEW